MDRACDWSRVMLDKPEPLVDIVEADGIESTVADDTCAAGRIELED